VLKPYEFTMMLREEADDLYFDICPTAQKDECFSMEKVLPSRNQRWPWNIPVSKKAAYIKPSDPFFSTSQ